jgi:ABC-2 type transport system permease protein
MIMKVFAITWKDLKHSFRSLFGLMFMFGIPLLMTGVFVLAFGGSNDSGSEAVEISAVQLGIVDEAQNEQSAELVALLSGEDLKNVLDIQMEVNESDSLDRISSGDIDVVMQIPAGFPKDNGIDLYAKYANDSNVTTVKNLVLSMLNTMDIQTALFNQLQAGAFLPENAEYLFSAPVINLDEQTAEPVVDSVVNTIIPNIMGAMMIFFAFFSGAYGAQSILTEEEQGTLQRLFVTGNSRQKILSGKFLAVWMMLVVQIASLLFISGWIFGIHWGNPAGQLLLAVGMGTAAAGFGILLLSFLRDMQSAGLVFSGAVMVTGFVGLGAIFTGSGELGNQALFVPQGWALKGLWALQSADVSGWILSALVLLAWGLILFGIGKIRFDRRYMREV